MTIESKWKEYRRKLPSDLKSKDFGDFKAYKQTGDRRLRNRLALANDRLAQKVAHRFEQICAVEYDDLEQLARIGLIKAIESFDPYSGNAFSSFAVPYIQGEILHFLRDHAWDMVKIPRRQLETAGQVKRITRDLRAAGRLDLDETRVAANLGMDRGAWQAIAEATARKPVVPLEEADWLAAEEEAEPEAEVVREEVKRLVVRLRNPLRYCLLERFVYGLDLSAIAQAHSETEANIALWIEEGLAAISAPLRERFG